MLPLEQLSWSESFSHALTGREIDGFQVCLSQLFPGLMAWLLGVKIILLVNGRQLLTSFEVSCER
jgi:hypothetical protein